MRQEDIQAYVSRDWEALGELKDRFWIERRQRYGIRWAMEVADELWRQVVALRPGWPDQDERDADRETHARVTQALQHVPRARGD